MTINISDVTKNSINLINQVLFQSADQELQKLDQFEIDENYFNSCLIIAKAWLRRGELIRSRKFLNLIKKDSNVFCSETYKNVAWELQDLEEIDYFGESIYPPGVPISERWRNTPPACIKTISKKGNQLTNFLIGRVTFINPDFVNILLTETENKKTYLSSILKEDWPTEYMSFPTKKVYIVFAMYQEQEYHIFPYEVPDPPWMEEAKNWNKDCIRSIIEFYHKY